MSDGTYGIVMFLSILASGAVLWLRCLRVRAMRRLLRQIKEQNPELFRDEDPE